MVNASKILTVSYGTFSCTLEGFDDPFSTMRSIAEYFRDLAADDRYFGAEPPTPDAEMLHRIAEREINRRVEAKVNKNGVVLRQIADERDVVEPKQAPTKGRPAKAVSPVEAAPAAKPTDQIADVDAPRKDAATVESVAEKLRRIRAAVARSHVEPQFSGSFAEDENADDIYSARSIDAAFAEDQAGTTPEVAAEPAPEIEAEQVEDTVAEATVDAPVAAEIEEAVADEVTEQPAESVADETEIEAEADQSEELVAEELTTDDEIDLSAALTTEDAPAEAVAIEASDDQAADEEDVFAIADEVAAEAAEETLEAEDEAEVEVAPASDAVAFEETSYESDEAEITETDLDLDALFADTAQDDDQAAKADVIEEETAAAEPAESADEIDFDSLTAALAADEAPEESSDAPETDAAAGSEPQVARARVVKMSRHEFMERYVEVSETSEIETDSASEASDVSPDQVRASLGETGLSPEDEDDLINELVAAERDAKDQPELAEAAGETEQDDVETEEARTDAEPLILGASDAADIDERPTAAVSPGTGKSGDRPVTRLLDKADSELKDNDSSRRRSAIAHLKAAVAAVRADGGRVQQDAAAEDAKTMNKFRSDLARVVRPETGAAEAAPARNPVTEDPAKPVEVAPEPAAAETPRPRRKMPPLMLVSEQRVDKPAGPDPDAAPVRPRRVLSEDISPEMENELHDGDGNISEDAAGNMSASADEFRDYVTATGADGVQELLEASTAFGTLVEGSAFNSRPQIMQRVLSFAPAGTLTREEGLRAFGVLLREGRVVRVQRGQFVLPETSRFREEAQSSAAG